MSEIKVNSIKGVGASAAAITVNNTDGTCTANITNKPNRNLIINGAMQVAQRGTSNTAGGDGYFTVDRMNYYNAGIDNDVTKAQVDVTAGTTPYTLGFRKALRITNGDQTSVGGTDTIKIEYKFEAQDIATSGWNYLSSSSFITLSFWVKSSVAQSFKFSFITWDGTARMFPMDTGALSANTWTKITKTIPGASGITINNDTGLGAQINFFQYLGTSYTGSVTENAWNSYGNPQTLTQTSTWYTTNDATFEITGVQLEVGSVATDFEHLSFADELRRCQRYYYLLASGNTQFMCMGDFWAANQADGGITLPVEMRATPSLDHTNGADYYKLWTNSTSSYIDGSVTLWNRSHTRAVTWYATPDTNRTGGHTARWITSNANAHFGFTAEL